MSELPLPCFFPLTKLVCCYPFVPPQQVAPAIDALYHPDLHLQFFVCSDSICDWLSAVFSAASGENVPFLSYFSCNEFIVCNLVHRSQIRLWFRHFCYFFSSMEFVTNFPSLKFCPQSSCLVLLSKESLSCFSYETAKN